MTNLINHITFVITEYMQLNVYNTLPNTSCVFFVILKIQYMYFIQQMVSTVDATYTLWW